MYTRAIIRPGQQLRVVEITDPTELAELRTKEQAHTGKVAEKRNDEANLNARQRFDKNMRRVIKESSNKYGVIIRVLARQKMEADNSLSRKQATESALADIVEDEWNDRL